MTFHQNGVTAHRGDSTNQPENTLPAFLAAVELGADWIELDVRLTADGKLVVIHDAETKRVAKDHLLVETATLKELQQIDVASAFRQQHGLSMAECPKARIPELREVFEQLRHQNQTRISVQPKPPVQGPDNRCTLVREIHHCARDVGAMELLGFNDGGLKAMTLVRELNPDVPVFWDMGPEHTEDDVAQAVAAGFESIVMRDDLVTRELIDQFKSVGIIPGVWTVDDRERLVELLRMGIERFYTNDPSLLLSLKRARRRK